MIEKINSDSRTFKAETERKTAQLDATLGGIQTSIDSLIVALSGQRTQDSAAVADRISGVENKLASLADNMAAVLLAVQGLQQGGKGYGKDQGPYDPGKAKGKGKAKGPDDAWQGQGKAKTLIQAPTAEPTAPVPVAAVDDTNNMDMDTNSSEQTRSVQTPEA